jgi:hypothetical protein
MLSRGLASGGNYLPESGNQCEYVFARNLAGICRKVQEGKPCTT